MLKKKEREDKQGQKTLGFSLNLEIVSMKVSGAPIVDLLQGFRNALIKRI